MIYRFDDIELDCPNFELRRAGEPVPVEPQVFNVLVHLIANRDRVVPKEELLDSVWRTRFVTEAALTSRIKAARRVAGDDGQRQAVIRTSHGRGYRFVAEVAELDSPGRTDGTTTERATPVFDQEIRFCQSSDGVALAYAVHGEGPPLLKAANWLTHLDYDWQSPVWRHWMEGLARRHQVVRYDERGCGLSDWEIDDFSLDGWVRDLEAVVEDAGLETFPLLGISQGAAVAISYAVLHPERVSHLVLYGSYGRGWLVSNHDDRNRESARTVVELARLGWGRRSPAFRQLFSASFMPEGTLDQWHAFDELQRRTTSPANAARFLEAFFQLDVMDIATRVRVPTLVLHCRGDEVWSFRAGRELAARIPGSRFVPLESSNHLILEHEAAWPRFLDEMERFLAT